MTHTLIKRGQARGQGGFAIGLILLVVLLIAVIIAAIALATRNGTSKGNEKDRVAASSLVQQAVSIDQAIQRASTSNGAPLWGQMIVNTAGPVATPNIYYNRGNNLYGANGGLLKPPSLSKDAFDGKCANASNYFNLNTAAAQGFADASALGCQWHITTIWGRQKAPTNVALGYDAGQADLGAAGVLYTFPLKGSIGSQVNSILWNERLGKSMKISGTPSQTVSAGLGKNWPRPGKSSDGRTNIETGVVLTTSTVSGTDFTDADVFFKSFGHGPAVNSGVIDLVSGTDGKRFPDIGVTSRREGVTYIGGDSATLTDDTEVSDGGSGSRVYYRALNTITE